MAGERYFIGPGLRDKLRETIIRVDSIARKEAGPTIPTSSQEMMRSSPGGGFRICTFTGAWSIDALKTVTFKYVTNTPNTVSAVNLFADVGAGCGGPRDCAIARDGTAWHLIAARCQ